MNMGTQVENGDDKPLEGFREPCNLTFKYLVCFYVFLSILIGSDTFCDLLREMATSLCLIVNFIMLLH